MVYLCILSLILSIICIILKLNGNEGCSTFVVLCTIILIVIVCYIFDEPQRMKEKCVELGIGKFVADEKANVKFYFINHKNELIEYNNSKKK